MNEEDMKILEEHLNFIKNFDNGSKYIPAWEKLIKEYRELEEELKREKIWRIRLEKENEDTCNEVNNNYIRKSLVIPKSKIKEIILIPMKEEHDKAMKEFIKKDIPQCVIAADVAQELSYFIGKIEELLEEK